MPKGLYIRYFTSLYRQLDPCPPWLAGPTQQDPDGPGDLEVEAGEGKDGGSCSVSPSRTLAWDALCWTGVCRKCKCK